MSPASWMSPSLPGVCCTSTMRLVAALNDAVTPASAALMRSITALSESEAYTSMVTPLSSNEPSVMVASCSHAGGEPPPPSKAASV